MADRTEAFFKLAGGAPRTFPPVPPCLWEALHAELPAEAQRSQQQQQQLLLQQLKQLKHQQQRQQQTAGSEGLAFKFLAVACSCQQELVRVQQQLHGKRARGSLSKEAAAAAGAAAAPLPVGVTAASMAAEVSLLLQRVRQQQQQAGQLEALAEDLSDLHALQQLRQQQQQQQQVGLETRDARAHRHAVLRCLYSSMQDVTGELQRLEMAALKQQMECRRYFSAAAAAGGPMGGPLMGASFGPAATEAAAAAEAAMRQQMSSGSKAGAAAAAVEQQQQQGQQDADSQLLLAEEQQLVATLSADSTDTVVAIQRKLQEIGQAMHVFAFKVAEQAEMCCEIGMMAAAALENVQGAEKHLSTALHRHSKFRAYVVYVFLAMGCLVLLLDFLKSSSPYLL